MSYKILLVEDEANLANAILLNLELEGYSPTWIKNGKTANSHLLSNPNFFDLVILDVMIPEKDGFEICKNYRDAGNNTPILFLSARNTAEDKITGLRLGADDYLGKPFNLEELLLRVEILLKRYNQAPTPSLNKVLLGKGSINFAAQSATSVTGLTINLSSLENQLLHYLVQRKGEVVSREDIIEHVWKNESIKGRSIDNLISRFRKWFEVDPKEPKHFVSVRGVGYRFDL
ncbi:MAG: DNA-binding response regulator [Crocinitomicaceae bacterium]|nr:DNA-binding response regulator [Crocinitomicaceae bacterium]|tara:strand:+ start:19035 stop:19727 length:693 start_codon:yes stop_codon:yes gene_type:complete